MQRTLSFFMAFCVALTLSFDAHAKRFGGGKSFGAAPNHQTRQVQQQRTDQSAAQQPGRQQAAAGGASRFLGPLAGLAAGGLLAAMFMGGAFEGLQIFDILIFGAIAFLLFRFLRSRRQQQQPAVAGHGAMHREMPAQQPASSIFGGSAAPVAAAPVINAPAWFDERRFVEAAREHFLSLQQHWDGNEMDKVAEFVTPELLQMLKQERAELGEGYQSTYVDNLVVALDGLDDTADKTIATLTFTGVAKNSRFDEGEPFSESWRMEREQGENQPWLIAGIRQNG